MPSPNRSKFGKKRILNQEYMQKTKKVVEGRFVTPLSELHWVSQRSYNS